MTNAIAFAKLEVWLRYPRPRPREGWRECAIPRPPERRKAGERG